jgi:hypothetical protein
MPGKHGKVESSSVYVSGRRVIRRCTGETVGHGRVPSPILLHKRLGKHHAYWSNGDVACKWPFHL